MKKQTIKPMEVEVKDGTIIFIFPDVPKSFQKTKNTHPEWETDNKKRDN